MEPIGDSGLSRGGGLRSGSCYRRDKAVASAGDSHDVTSILAPVPQRLAEVGNVDAEISLLHRHIRPNAGDQLLLSDDFSSPLNQRDQRVERATTELECLVPFLELPLGRKQVERAKRHNAMHKKLSPSMR